MPGSPVVDLRNSWGVAFIGAFVSTMLYGMAIAQTWFYFSRFRNRDPIFLRGLVVVLLALDTLHTIMCIYAVYWYLVPNFGNVENLGLSMWAMNFQVDVAGIIAFLVQLFYARRVYIMSNSIVLPLIIAVLGSIPLCLGFVLSAKTAALKEYSRWDSLTWITCTAMSLGAATDILIVVSMCWCLYHKRTGFSNTDPVIMTLMVYSANTGLLTSLLAIGTLVAFATQPSGLLTVAFFWQLCKCYVNSFLAILNNRDNLRERSSRENRSDSISLSSVRRSSAPFKCKTEGSTSLAVTVCRSGTTDIPGSKHGYNNELNALELVKTEGDTTSSAREESIV